MTRFDSIIFLTAGFNLINQHCKQGQCRNVIMGISFHLDLHSESAQTWWFLLYEVRSWL